MKPDATGSDPATPITWMDGKRRWWSLSLLMPLLPLLGIALAEGLGQRTWLWLPVVFIYAVVPLLDWLVGTDPHNPPEAVVPALEGDA